MAQLRQLTPQPLLAHRTQACSQPRTVSALFTTAVAGFAALRRGTGQQRPRRSNSVVVWAWRDHYSILGVPRTASKDIVKAAYRRLARQTHPDVCKDAGAVERFKEIRKAYEVLSDDDERAKYDSEEGLRRGAGVSATPREREAPSAPTYRSATSNNSNGDGSSRARSSRASTGTTTAPPRPSPGDAHGNDLRHELHMDASEAELGTRKTVNFTRHQPCGTCLGRGRNTDKDCAKCSGLGWIVRGVNNLGKGKQETTCKACQGEGRVRTSQCISVRVPAGTPDGTWLRVRGRGDVGRSGSEPGDLFLRIRYSSK